MTKTLIVTSGCGPKEVRRFVSLLAAYLMRRFTEKHLMVSNVIHRGEADAPISVRMDLSGDDFHLPESELGTHVLVAASSRRKKGSRKRWFARVALTDATHASKAVSGAAFREEDIEISACRASGPGGQHVNKTASAVRAVHRPSGIVVRVESERSQHANRAKAVERIKDALERRSADGRRAERHRLRHEHYLVERGNPIRTYVLNPKGQLESIDD